MLQDGPGGGGTENDGHHAARAAAARAGEDVGLEGPPEELGPGDGAARRPGAEGSGVTGQEAASASGAGKEARARRGAAPWRWGRRRRSNARGWPWGVGRARPPGGGGQRRQQEVRLSCRRGPLHPVGEPSVGQGRQPLERQGPAGAVVAEPLEARDVVFVKPGVGVEEKPSTKAQRRPGRRAGGRGRSAAPGCLRAAGHRVLRPGRPPPRGCRAHAAARGCAGPR